MSLATQSERAMDPQERVDLLLRDLRSSLQGLSEREAARRLVVHGPNEIQRRARRSVWSELTRQLTHPLALLLWAAAGLSLLERNLLLAAAIATVVVLNAAFAFVQERHAERAVEAYQRPGVAGRSDARARLGDPGHGLRGGRAPRLLLRALEGGMAAR